MLYKIARQYKYNIYSLINLFASFVFTALFAYIYKVTESADSYFFSIIIFNSFYMMVQVFFATFFQFYLSKKLHIEKNALFTTTLIITLFSSVILLLVLEIFLSNTSFWNESIKSFLSIYVINFIFLSIIDVSKQLMNAERFFAFSYMYSIFLNVLYIFILFMQSTFHYGINVLAYSSLVYNIIIAIGVLIFIFYHFKFQLIWNLKIYKRVVRESFITKIGLFLYGLPELILSNYLTQNFEGILAIYSYLKKIVAGMLAVIFNPKMTIYITEISVYIKENNYIALKHELKSLWKQTIPLFVLSSIIVGLFLIKILSTLIDDSKLLDMEEDIFLIYVILILINFIIMFEYPYGAIINQKLNFIFALKVNAGYSLLFLLLYVLIADIIGTDSYYSMFVLFVFAQLMNAFFVIRKSMMYMR